MKFLKSEEGSTLMLVLITVSMLVILGTALLSMTLMNVNMKQNDKRIKASIYYAESGVDQVYAKMGKIVEDAIAQAIQDTDTDVQQILIDLDDIVDSIDPLTGLPDPTSKYMDFILGDSTNPTYSTLMDASNSYILKPDELEPIADALYKGHFRKYFTDLNLNAYPNNIEGLLEGITKQNIDDDYLTNGSSIDISVGNVNDTEFGAPAAAPAVNELRIENVRSEFWLADKTKKVVTTDIVISDNIADYPMNATLERLVVQDNPIWQQPLVAILDVDFSGSNTTVDGNIYGYGDLSAAVAAGYEAASPTLYGGVMVSNDSNVTVNGNIFSRGYVQLAPGTLSNSNSGNLTVNFGHVYANSVVIQKYASGDMLIDEGNVYTSDDLEMNGTDSSSITIDGSYYGYTDGSLSSVTHDGSSAIVLNSDMDQASLSINGTRPSGAENRNELEDGIVIGGTAYINVDPGNRIPDPDPYNPELHRYQTGESVALRGNGLAYTWSYDQAAVDAVNLANKYALAPYNIYSAAEHDNKITDFLLNDISPRSGGMNSVLWQDAIDADGNFITKVAKGTNVDQDTSTAVLDWQSSVDDKMVYFLEFRDSVIGPDPSTLFRRGLNVNLQNYYYTTGLQLRPGGSSNVFGYHPSDVDRFDDICEKIADDYLYQLHMMEYRNGLPMTNVHNVGSTGVAPTVGNANIVEKFTDLNYVSITGDNYYVAPVNSTSADDGVTTVKQVVFASKSTAALHINGNTYAVTGDIEKDIDRSGGDPHAQGIIINKGDIYIYGDFDFNGAIITEGDIYTVGGSQTFRNNTPQIRDYLVNLIYNDDKLYDIFMITNYAGGSGAVIDFGGATLETVRIVNNTNVTGAVSYNPQHNNVFDYDDWMHLEYWKVAE